LKKRAEGKITREQYLSQKKKLTGRTGGNPSGKKSKKNGPPSLPRKNIDAQVYAQNRFAQKANKVKSSGKDSWTPGNVSGALVARTPAGMARCYLASMVDPKNHMCRIPDSFNRKTSLFRSVVTYDYPFVTTGASERFSVALQPIIGDVDTPTHYQLAIVNNANANVTWDENTDWTNAATYCDDLGGTDPRVDINAPYLVNPPVSFGGIKDTWLGTLITSTNWFSPASQGVSPNNVVVTDLNSFRFRGRNSAPADYTRMLVPAGTWMLIIQWTFTPSANAVNVSINTNNGNTATVLQSYRDTLAAVTAGTSYNLTVSYIVSSDGTVNGGSMNQALVVAAGGVLANPTASVTSVWITNTAVSNQSFPSSFGVIEEMRPVSCSVWACCNAPGLVNGGEIAAAYVPKDYLTSNFFANSQNGSGNGQYYETLSKLEGAFNGPFKMVRMRGGHLKTLVHSNFKTWQRRMTHNGPLWLFRESLLHCLL